MSPMEHMCGQYDKIRGHISAMYTILMHVSVKFTYITQWEQEIQETLDLEAWHSIALTASRSLINTSIVEANYKVLLRWYLVPAGLATFVPRASSKCFWGCGQEGTAYHIWWQCPKVQRFLIRVYNLIYTLTQTNLAKSPKARTPG